MSIKEEAVKNITDIKIILDEIGIPFWLDGGTSLGKVFSHLEVAKMLIKNLPKA